MAQPNPEAQALEMLTQTLTTDATVSSALASDAIATTARSSNDMQSEYYAVAGISKNATRSSAANAPNGALIATLPAGNKILFNNQIRTQIDPITGDISVFSAAKVKESGPAPTFSQLDAMVSRAEIANPVDVDSIIARSDSMDGQQRGTYLLQAISAIDTATANRSALLKQQAVLESGVQAASDSVIKFTQAAKLKGYDPTKVYEVVNAQAVRQNALQTAVTQANLLMATDPIMQKLIANKSLVTGILAKTAGRDAAGQDQADMVPIGAQKAAIAYFGQQSDQSEYDFKRMVYREMHQNPIFKHLADFNPETAPNLLTSPIKEVATGALRILKVMDWKKNNPNETIVPSADDIQPNGLIKEIAKIQLMDPKALINTYESGKEAKQAQLQGLLMAGSGKEGQLAAANIRANYLQKAVEKYYLDSWGNASGWNLPTNSPLAKTVADIKSASKDGKAPYDRVLATFVNDATILDATGKRMPFADRIKFVEDAVRATAAGEVKSVLMQNPQNIELQMLNNVKTTMIKMFVGKRVEESMRGVLQTPISEEFSILQRPPGPY